MKKKLRLIPFLTAAFSLLSLLSNQTLACTGHDIVIQNITITSISTHPNYYSYMYSYQIKNIGTAAIALNKVVLQNYISTNATFEPASDEPGGGAYIVLPSNTDVIAAGATYSGTFEISAGLSYPVSSYPYFVVEIYLNSETECDITNNTYSGLIQVTTTGTQTAQLATANVHWNTETKIFTVKNWLGNTTSSLQYTVFNMSGMLLLSGNTAEGQATPMASLQNGMYIIYLTDGEKVYSKKIIY